MHTVFHKGDGGGVGGGGGGGNAVNFPDGKNILIV